MKSFIKISLLIPALGFIFFSGCKKYPDGPLFSIYSPQVRILGEWDVNYFSVNGFDSTSYLKAQPFYARYYIRSSKLDNYSTFFALLNPGTGYNGQGYWMFLENKTKIYFHLDLIYVPGNIGPYCANDITWKIRRLKKDELWLETEYLNKVYFVKFSRK
ncbi:MAG: hypothetical protein NTX97_03445 [Bacteroidetes bacterium]|nr:hypothetical protein [Bacteroidota bacterium]